MPTLTKKQIEDKIMLYSQKLAEARVKKNADDIAKYTKWLTQLNEQLKQLTTTKGPIIDRFRRK